MMSRFHLHAHVSRQGRFGLPGTLFLTALAFGGVALGELNLHGWEVLCEPAHALTYPQTRKCDQVDDYFGTRIADPYRWLEDDRSAETAAWVEAQNAVTFAHLREIPFREALKERLTRAYDYARYSAPLRVGERYFFSKNDGLQNQSVIYVQDGLAGEPRVFLDPNALSPDGTIRIALLQPSGDKRWIAISRSEAGSDWSEIRVMDVASGAERGDIIRWVKFSGAAWWKDGFFYSGYDRPAEGSELTAVNQNQKIFYHRLGDPQEKDLLVHEDASHPLRYYDICVSEDEAYAFLSVSEGTSGTELYWRDLRQPDSRFLLLMKGFDHDSAVIDNDGDRILVRTNLEAPNGKVIRIDPRDPDPAHWETIIPERPQALGEAAMGGGRLFCTYLVDATTRAYEYDAHGRLLREIALPDIGTARGFGGWKNDRATFFTFSSYTYPPAIYLLDIETGATTLFRRAEAEIDPDAYEMRQVFFPSKDGTRIPMFIVHKKGLVLDGSHPCYLTGYGGFNYNIQPYYRPATQVLLEQGVVYAEPNLRGGSEYGESWHKAGMLEKKQNVFDDFIAAAEYLIREGYTSSAKLGIEGASNGGLLVGAVMTQRPDLFGVALPDVGVMDMLRFQRFTVGWGWATEYGSSDNERDFQWLRAYSPLHNLRAGTAYPATLVTTADHDDRVVPAHSFKFIATLQEAQAGPHPVLIRVETRSGHGASNVRKTIESLADVLSFFLYHAGAKPAWQEG